MPSVGFALDLDRLAWALRESGCPMRRQAKVVCIGNDAAAVVTAFRLSGIAAAPFAGTHDGALAYARDWGFDVLVTDDRVVDVATRSEIAINRNEISEVARYVVNHVQRRSEVSEGLSLAMSSKQKRGV